MKVLYVCLTLALFVCLLLSFERPAMAYVDPGSGLFMFQSLSSIGVATLFFLRRRIRMMFRGGTAVDPLLRSEAAGLTGKAQGVEAENRKAA